MSLSICTVAYGKQYEKFLPRWIDNLNNLNIKVNDIVVAYDHLSYESMKSIEKNNNIILLKIHGVYKNTPAIYFNQAIEACQSEWVIRSDIDDLLLPAITNKISQTEKDIIGINHYNSDGEVVIRQFNDFSKILESNLLPSCSPFKKWIWDKNKIQDTIWEDWIFWINAYKNGATAESTTDFGFIYNVDIKEIPKNITDIQKNKAQKIIEQISKNINM